MPQGFVKQEGRLIEESISFCFEGETNLAQTIPSATDTVVSFNRIIQDQSGEASLVSNQMRLPIGHYDFELKYHGDTVSNAYFVSVPMLYNVSNNTTIRNWLIPISLYNLNGMFRLIGSFILYNPSFLEFRLHQAGASSNFELGILADNPVGSFYGENNMRVLALFTRYITLS